VFVTGTEMTIAAVLFTSNWNKIISNQNENPLKGYRHKNANVSGTMIKLCAFCYKMLLIPRYCLLATITLIKSAFSLCIQTPAFYFSPFLI
jgi:hypothetical protein